MFYNTVLYTLLLVYMWLLLSNVIGIPKIAVEVQCFLILRFISEDDCSFAFCVSDRNDGRDKGDKVVDR